MLKKDVVGEILEGCRRDKLLPLPGGIVLDIELVDICLRDATPWVMGVRVHQLRSDDEIWLEARVRFVSDAGAVVKLKIVTLGGKLPIYVENISVEVPAARPRPHVTRASPAPAPIAPRGSGAPARTRSGERRGA